MSLPKQRPGVTIDEPTALSVWEVVQQVQAGDTEAFGQIYERYFEVVFRFLYRQTQGNRVHAEDLTAETFAKALKGIGQFTWQNRDFGAWLVTIARNLHTDSYKAKWGRFEVSTEDNGVLDRPDGSREADPESAMDQMTADVLHVLVDQLPEGEREAIRLRYWHGLTVEETCAVTGKLDGAIKAATYRAYCSLANLIGDGIDHRGRAPRARVTS